MRYRAPRNLLRRHEILKMARFGGSFLEIGAGNLHLTRDLIPFFEKGTVIEMNPHIDHLLKALPESVLRRLSLVIEDFMTAEINLKFDCVIATEVLEHINEDAAFLVKARSLLKSGGQLIISVPSRMKHWNIDDETAGHLRRYERNDLRRLLHDAGFIDVHIISYGYPAIMIFRALRILLAKKESKHLRHLSSKTLTMKSGMPRNGFLFSIAGLICNPITIAPFALLASLFNHLDLSDGYLATAWAPSQIDYNSDIF